MRFYTMTMAAIAAVFLFLAFIVKSRYYYFPYPNAIEYLLALFLIILGLTVCRKRKIGLRKRLLTGSIALISMVGMISLLNLVYEWHPLNLNPPFGRSQSFEVGFEPYQWQTDSPGRYGYDQETLDAWLAKAPEWKRLRALLVVKGDKLIVERYLAGTTKYSAFNVHSVTKSVTSALVGLAIKHDYIASDAELVLPFFPEYQSHPFGKFKQALTIQHLLSMRGGWSGGDGHQTVEQCMLAETLHRMPGTQFRYFTGSQNILSAIVSKSTKTSSKEFADKNLLQPLGIKNAFWRKSGGYYCGGDESYYTARDLARFGKLYADGGTVDGVPLLDSGWVRKSFTNYTDSSSDFRSLAAYTEAGYGLCWWILRHGSHTIYAARGKGGQHVMVIPDQQLVIVILQEWNPLMKNPEVEDSMLAGLLTALLPAQGELAHAASLRQ